MQPLKSEDSEGIGSTEPSVAYQKRETRWRFVLISVMVILLIICVVFIALFAVEKRARKDAEEKARKIDEGVSTKEMFCKTKDCLLSAYDMLQQLNQSVDPCEDFYQYACGGWIQKNPLKKGEPVKNAMSIIQTKNNKILRQAIEMSWLNYPKNEAVMKTAKFYNVCIDEAAVEKEGMAPLQQLIKDLGGWHITGPPVIRPLLSRLAQMNRELYNRPLFNVIVFINPTNSNKHVLTFGRASTGMSKNYYVTDSPDNLKVREAYKQYMKDVAKLLGGKNNSDSLMMQVYDFESKLATIEKQTFGLYTTIEEHLRGTVASAGGLFSLTQTLEQFSKASNVSMSIMNGFLNEVFKEQKFVFTKDEPVFAWPSSYFMKLFSLFINQSSIDPKVLDNYAMWTAINQHIAASPSKFVEAKLRFLHALEGNKTFSRPQSCLTEMQRVLKMPLGLLFVEKAFNEDSKKMVKDMTRYVRQAFLNNINGYDWMDTYTKQQAKAKAEAIVEDVGYPDYIKDPVKLANTLKGLQVGDKLFDNVRKMIRFAVKEDLDRLNKTVDRDRWLLGPSQANGYYAPNQNRIVFLAGILQPPFYNPVYPMYLTFGSIGMVIGHEITHGFDTQGRLYDKDGNIRNWWSQTSLLNFLKRSKCLVNQYSNFELFGAKINGNSTINENIADNGGIKIAYEGYKAWSKEKAQEGVLPGLGLTVDQLFFVGFAQPWCSIYTKKPALTQIKLDSHSNGKYRVIGTLQNYQKFAEVFKCKPNSYMNPTKKCKVW